VRRRAFVGSHALYGDIVDADCVAIVLYILGRKVLDRDSIVAV